MLSWHFYLDVSKLTQSNQNSCFCFCFCFVLNLFLPKQSHHHGPSCLSQSLGVISTSFSSSFPASTWSAGPDYFTFRTSTERTHFSPSPLVNQGTIISHLSNWMASSDGWLPVIHSSLLRLLNSSIQLPKTLSVGWVTPCLYGNICGTLNTYFLSPITMGIPLYQEPYLLQYYLSSTYNPAQHSGLHSVNLSITIQWIFIVEEDEIARVKCDL